MKNIITLTGNIGSGKTEVSQILSEKLGYEIKSTGTMQRQIAAEKNLTTLELNQLSMEQSETDYILDNFLKQLNVSGDNLIIDSRLGWHFIKNSFKVYIRIHPKISAERVFQANRHGEDNKTPEETYQNNIRRQQLESERFKKLYGIVFPNLDCFDLIVDSSFKNAREVADEIFGSFEKAKLKFLNR